MLQLVKVRLRKPKRVLVFTVKDLTLERDDLCIVRTEWGLESGVCINEPEDCAPEAAKRYTMSVVRKATSTDEETIRQIEDEERQAAALCVRRIRERNLPMQVVDAEYTFDRHKVVVNFTADDRVDFRELVRDLAQDLKARIELRHIQVRDKAKIVGGLAGCGRELCCGTWLSAFMPISMKMAKKQNLSLNPSKISGQCGRLMCCLSYENDMYESPRKKKPPCQADGGEEPGEAQEAAAAQLAKPAPSGRGASPSRGGQQGKGAGPRPPKPPTVRPPQERPVPATPIEELDREEPVTPDDIEEGDEDEEDDAVPVEGGQEQEGEPGQKKRKRSRRRRRRRKGGSGAGADQGQSGEGAQAGEPAPGA